MSELKVYEFDTDYPNDIQSGSYYDKSEADKVIARHKYKRCLAMAEKCDARYDE